MFINGVSNHAKNAKPKKCKVCKDDFYPFRTTQRVCSPTCAVEFGKQKEAEKRRKEARKEKLEYRKRSKQFRLAQAQMWFNKWIRLRDKYEPCISCQRHHAGQYHAGHYRSVGAARQLRFNEDNCHKQCSVCNNHKSGNIAEYRINLIKKIGLENVEALENSNESRKYTIEEITAIEEKYKRKSKEMEG